MTFCAGEQCFQWDTFVAPIKEDGLLGLDFLCTQDYTMNKLPLVLNQRKFPVAVTLGDVKAAQVTLKQDVVIPVVSVCCQRGNSGKSTLWETCST